METKLPLIETDLYWLAVSYEEIKERDWYIDDYKIIRCSVTSDKGYWNTRKEYKKIIGYLPKGSAPEFDLLLLPEMDVEDDVEKTAKEFAKKGSWQCPISFIEGYKTANKGYSEDDLRKAINMAREESGLSDNSMSYDYDEDEIIKSLKQPKTPKWFVADIIDTNIYGSEVLTGFYDSGNFKLKTTTINGKLTLTGYYL
jgi:hypothetical protein